MLGDSSVALSAQLYEQQLYLLVSILGSHYVQHAGLCVCYMQEQLLHASIVKEVVNISVLCYATLAWRMYIVVP